MAISLRISSYRMTERLFSHKRAYGDALRQWGAAEAARLALAVVWGRYGEADAHAELATFLAWQAETAGIKTVSCQKLAGEMLDDAIASLDAALAAICRDMVDAVHVRLDADPDDFAGATAQATAIARERQAPPSLISAGMRIAMRER